VITGVGKAGIALVTGAGSAPVEGAADGAVNGGGLGGGVEATATLACVSDGAKSAAKALAARKKVD